MEFRIPLRRPDLTFAPSPRPARLLTMTRQADSIR